MGTTAEKLQAIKSSKENIRLAINEKGVTVDTSAPLSTYADSIKQISTSEEYDPANAKQYRAHNRNKNWPTIQLPSEMGESGDHIVFLLDLSVPRRFFALTFTASNLNEILITSAYYKDTVNTRAVQEASLTSDTYQNYYTAENGENYLIVDIYASRGNLSNLIIGTYGTYGNTSLDSGILEISGNCSSVKLVMNTTSCLLRTPRMEYFSFYGLNQYNSSSLFFGFYDITTGYFSELKAVPELKFVSTANIVLPYTFNMCRNLVCIDDTAFDGHTIFNAEAAFRECRSLINCGHMTNFTEYFRVLYAFMNCSSLTYMPIAKLPHSTYTSIDTYSYIYEGCLNITDISEAYSDPENDGFTKGPTEGMFIYTHITELPETFIEGEQQNLSVLFQNCPIVTYRGTLNGTTTIANNNAFASCQQFRMTNIKRSLDIRNSTLNAYNLYTREELLWIFNNGLEKVDTSPTLTIGAAALALLSDSDKAIATDKGWTLS